MSAVNDTAPRLRLKSKPIVHGYVVTNEMLEEIAKVLIKEDELKKAYARNWCTRVALIDWLEKRKFEHDILPLGWRDYRDGVPRFYNLWICMMFITPGDVVPKIPLNKEHFYIWWKASGGLEITKTAWAHTMKYPEYLCLPDWMRLKMEAWSEQAVRKRAAKQSSVEQPPGSEAEETVNSTA